MRKEFLAVLKEIREASDSLELLAIRQGFTALTPGEAKCAQLAVNAAFGRMQRRRPVRREQARTNRRRQLAKGFLQNAK